MIEIFIKSIDQNLIDCAMKSDRELQFFMARTEREFWSVVFHSLRMRNVQTTILCFSSIFSNNFYCFIWIFL